MLGHGGSCKNWVYNFFFQEDWEPKGQGILGEMIGIIILSSLYILNFNLRRLPPMGTKVKQRHSKYHGFMTVSVRAESNLVLGLSPDNLEYWDSLEGRINL